MKKQREIQHNEWLTSVKEKLGLEEDATEEEIREAMKEKRGEMRGYKGCDGENCTFAGFVERHQYCNDKNCTFVKKYRGCNDEENCTFAWGYKGANHSADIKEKLGLPEDATMEEVREAMKEKRGEIEGMSRHGFRGMKGHKFRGQDTVE